jgi:hypothetical protein
MKMSSKEGTVNIHGKTYKTVALRVAEFRKEHPDWELETQIHSVDDAVVIMKAIVARPAIGAGGEIQMLIVGTGYAEERRDSSQINKTSALENCETSAIGRALAACGYGGTEYASANEVENAIHQQKRSTSISDTVLDNVERAPDPIIDDAEMAVRQALNRLDDGQIDKEQCKEAITDAVFAFSGEEKVQLWQRFDSKQRSAIKREGMDW